MKRQVTAASLAQFHSTDANVIQDQAASMSMASKNCWLSASQPQGLDFRSWLANATIANATLLTIEDSQDWHDRFFPHVAYQDLGDALAYPGGTDDAVWGCNGLGSPSPATPNIVSGFMGKGAQKTGGGQVTAGSPPVPANGTSWAIRLATTGSGIWLYCDSFDSYKLKLYNNSGGTLTLVHLFWGWTAQTGQRT